jgi:hypothetical protein
VLADRHAARGAEPLMLNTPSGRFCNGKSRDRWRSDPAAGDGSLVMGYLRFGSKVAGSVAQQAS